MSIFNLPENETALDLIGKSFGRGVATGMQNSVNDFYKKKERIEKGRPQVLSSLNSLMKFGGIFDTYDESHKDLLRKRANQLFEGGLDPFTAADQALDELTSNKGMFAPKQGEEKKTKAQSLLGTPISEPFKNTSKDIRNTELLQQEKQRGLPEALKNKPIELLSPQELLSLPSEYVNSLPMEQQRKVGKQIAEMAHRGTGFSLLKGADPTGLFSALERGLSNKGASPIPQETPETEGPSALLHALGSFVPLAGISKIANIPKTLAGKSATSAGLFAAEGATRKALGEGETPTFGDILINGAIGGAFPLLSPLIGPVWNQLKRIPSLFKNVSTAAKAAEIPAEQIVKQAAVDSVTKAIGPAGALEAPEAIEKRAVELVEKANSGDAKALNTLQKETAKVAEVHEKAAKFSQKEIEKVREEVAEKLPKSPLEEHYKIEEEVSHRPETILREEERVKPLHAKIKQNERSLKNAQYEVFRRENDIADAIAAKAPQESIQRMQSALELDRMQHQRILNEIRNTEFEIKHKKPRATTEEIQKQIETQHERLRKLITNPDPKEFDKIRKRIADDQKAIETAKKLLERGKMPGPEVRDEFIKIREEYEKGYKTLENELKGFVKEHKSDKAMADKVKNANDVLKVVQDAQKVVASKIAIQKDKRLVKRLLERPSGAFYKERLKKELADDKRYIEAFDKNFIKFRQATSPEEVKTAAKAKELIKSPSSEAKPLGNVKQAQERASKAVKNPTVENVKPLAEELGVDQEKVSPFIKELKEEAASGAKKVEQGIAKEADVKKTAAEILKKFNKMGPFKKGIIVGPILGVVQGLSEEYFGYKPSATTAGLVAGGVSTALGYKNPTRGFISGSVSGPIAGFVYRYIHDAYNHKEAQKLRSLRNTPEFNKHLKELAQRYSPTRANQIKKEALGQ